MAPRPRPNAAFSPAARWVSTASTELANPPFARLARQRRRGGRVRSVHHSIDLMRVVSGLLLPAVAYLARRKTRWDYSKFHKRRRQARRARFAPILDLRASLPKTGTDDSHKLAAPNPDPANAGNPK